MRHRDKSEHDSAVCRWAARRLQVTFEEGSSAAWLYDLLKPHVTKLLVCDPRKNASMREGNQSDKIDARRLAELLRLNHLNPVYHGEHGLRSLKELVRSYLTITKRSRTGHDAGEGHLFVGLLVRVCTRGSGSDGVSLNLQNHKTNF
jgi:hypothetical protein